MAKLANRVRFTTATTGTGTITAGAAVAGFRDPAGDSNLADGDTVAYFIEDGTAWEHGTGVLGSTKTTMTRVLRESSTGALLNLSGSAEVFLETGRRDMVLANDGHAAIGNFAGIDSATLAPGDPTNALATGTISFPVVINEYRVGDFGASPYIDWELSEFILYPGWKHTGAGEGIAFAADFVANINSDSTGPFSFVTAHSAYIYNYGSGDIGNLWGAIYNAQHLGASNAEDAFGIATGCTVGASATADRAGQIHAGGNGGAIAGTVTEWATVLVDAPTSAGTVTNLSGVKIADHSALGGTTSYNILSKGASSKNVFEGTLDIGHATDTTLSRASAGVLAVEGNNILTTATGQPLDADLTAIAALTTDAAGRSGLTLTDPGADHITFWDDSASSMAYLTLNGLVITGTVLSAVLQGHIYGLTMSNAADTANDITVAAGEATSESGTDLIVLAAPITKQLDAAWAVGTNAGGINTGAEANSTWYEVHLIKRPDTGVVDVMFTTTANRATLPASYTLQRRIGWIRNDGAGAILQFTQIGDHFTLTTQVNDVAASVTTTAAAVALTAPPNSIARFRASVESTTSVNANAAIVFSEIVEGNVTPAITTGIASLGQWDLATGASAGHFELRVSATSTIEHDAQVGSGTFDISTYGWIDFRRRKDAI
jgi:hypothetical protein